jgi:hypothetical protein
MTLTQKDEVVDETLNAHGRDPHIEGIPAN